MKNFVRLEKILIILALACHALFAQAPTTRFTFYFLPPNDDKWIAGNSYLYNGDADAAELMQIDDTRCGWFKKEFRTVDDIPEKALIFLGPQGTDKLDTNGKEANIGDPGWIPLKAKFGTSSALYLIADETGMIFSTIAPGDQGEEQQNRCSYKMAAFIYDTDGSVNPSFSGTYIDQGATNNGIRRGIVKPDLDTATRKPVFSTAKARWANAESFNAAFTPKGLYKDTISNIPRCYDMPFSRSATNGTWEFDSDRMRNPSGNNLVGGFYPYILDSAYTLTDVEANYTDCPACRKEYTAQCFNRMNTTQLNNLEVTYKGATYTGIEAFDRTYFPDGTTHDTYYDNTYGCTAPSPGFTNTTKTKANLSFCFESHGEFIYEKGQEFFFRGDDDIWVFINNRLVIDLGGTHMPAPGFVDLDSIGRTKPGTTDTLIEGKRYPIDIFFCERMGTQSNVRVSTNMYIVQKSTFYSKPPDKTENWMCATNVGGSTCAEKLNESGASRQEDLCGAALIKNGKYSLDFYMVRRGSSDTLYLSVPKLPTQQRGVCEGVGNTFACYVKDATDPTSGIKIDNAVYSCGGRNQCKGNAAATKKITIPSGNWTVYARFMDATTNKMVDGSKPLLIDNIKSITNARIVWGNLNTEYTNNPIVLKDAYDSTTKEKQSIIAGKRTPIYIAGGTWKDTINHTSFVYENDSESIANISYTLASPAGLEVTLDKFGEKKAVFPRSLPPSGIDTLWVMGDFYMGEKEFDINLEGISNSAETPSLKLTVYQPTLRFTKDTSYATFVNPTNPSNASGFDIWTGSKTELPFVGKALDVYVVAWDTLKNVLCSHCTFILGENSTTNNDSIGDGIVYSDAMRIENGKQIIYIRGRGVVDGTNYATWRIYGPSKNFTFAVWDSLQFRDAPVPMPLESYVYDRNGDGIGDSLIVKFSKPFKEKGEVVARLLPLLLEVTWEKGNTVAFYNPKYDIKNLKDTSYVRTLYTDANFYTENLAYWNKYLTSDSITMIIADTNTTFSKNILTAGKGNFSSYTPYYDQSACPPTGCRPTDLKYLASGYSASVFDRIPPIVTRAVYKMDKKKCGSSPDIFCRDTVVAYLSEPVFADPDAEKIFIDNPFSYCFEYSQGAACENLSKIDRKNVLWNNIGLNGKAAWAWYIPKKEGDYASSANYRPSKRTSPPKYYEGASKGDSIVNLFYHSHTATTMPKAKDWIKIRPPVGYAEGKDVFRDAEGNSSNPREIGVLITGENRYSKDQLKIASIDPNANPEDPAGTLGGTFANPAQRPPWITPIGQSYADNNLFNDTAITEFLPIPNWPSSVNPIDSIKIYYPASVGTILKYSNNILLQSDSIWNDCKSGGCTTKNGPILSESDIAKAISLHASVYYHTNIGDYTAHRDPIEANCTDPIFQGSGFLEKYGNNCLGNEYNFYLAWDLKTNKNRYVGTGAYVAITKSYWQIEYIKNGSTKSTKFNPDEFVEMFGVRRKE